MLRVQVCATLMAGFLVPNSLIKGSFFSRFSLNMGGFSSKWQKIVNMGSFPPKFITTVGMMASFGNQKRVGF